MPIKEQKTVKYIAAQQEWAVKTIDVFTYSSILRDNTTTCKLRVNHN